MTKPVLSSNTTVRGTLSGESLVAYEFPKWWLEYATADLAWDWHLALMPSLGPRISSYWIINKVAYMYKFYYVYICYVCTLLLYCRFYSHTWLSFHHVLRCNILIRRCFSLLTIRMIPMIFVGVDTFFLSLTQWIMCIFSLCVID